MARASYKIAASRAQDGVIVPVMRFALAVLLVAACSRSPSDPGTHTFRWSSVRGDFRVYKTAAGLVASWKTLLSARTRDGRQLWRKDGFGIGVAISPDGKRVLANNKKQIAIFDAATGAVIASGQLGDEYHPKHIDAFAWTPDGRHIIGVSPNHVYVIDEHVQLERELNVPGGGFFTAVVAPSNDEILLAAHSDLLRVRLADGTVLGRTGDDAHDIDLRGSTCVINGYVAGYEGRDRLLLVDTSLKPIWRAWLPGERILRSPQQKDGEGTHFVPIPKLSPDGKTIAVNGADGTFWLLNATDGKTRLRYPPELADLVEDFAWLDDDTLVVLDNPGRISAIGSASRKIWSFDDAPPPERVYQQ
jgi:WD40 repeat protein